MVMVPLRSRGKHRSLTADEARARTDGERDGERPAPAVSVGRLASLPGRDGGPPLLLGDGPLCTTGGWASVATRSRRAGPSRWSGCWGCCWWPSRTLRGLACSPSRAGRPSRCWRRGSCSTRACTCWRRPCWRPATWPRTSPARLATSSWARSCSPSRRRSCSGGSGRGTMRRPGYRRGRPRSAQLRRRSLHRGDVVRLLLQDAVAPLLGACDHAAAPAGRVAAGADPVAARPPPRTANATIPAI